MISVENVTKCFADMKAVDNVSFAVEKGEILGFLGPNGAGKTTTMRILAGYIPATSGKATVAGYDVFTRSMEVRKRIGYLPETVPLYAEMRVSEYLRFRGRLKGIPGKLRKSRVSSVLSSVGALDVSDRVIGHLSKGFRQRVGLAEALLGDPEILILDEPTIGLDPNQVREVRSLIRDLRGGHTVILSTHILPEVEMLCEKVAIINHGKIVAMDTIRNLAGGESLILEVKGPETEVKKALSALEGVLRSVARPTGETITYSLEVMSDSKELRERISQSCSRNGWPIIELRRATVPLEEIFARITAEE